MGNFLSSYMRKFWDRRVFQKQLGSLKLSACLVCVSLESSAVPPNFLHAEAQPVWGAMKGGREDLPLQPGLKAELLYLA